MTLRVGEAVRGTGLIGGTPLSPSHLTANLKLLYQESALMEEGKQVGLCSGCATSVWVSQPFREPRSQWVGALRPHHA